MAADCRLGALPDDGKIRYMRLEARNTRSSFMQPIHRRHKLRVETLQGR